ncbi:MAG: hypothetical protein COB35_10870 [Gammaproteobacteria bacterium]|nr:MAG: hypothetical protein COB35_10870 [Gammaproteobacteria bacterium]
MIDIQPKQLEELIKILKTHLKTNTSVYAFGSRTNGTARKFSDLDLIIKGQQPLNFKDKIALQEDFSESDLSFRVDISDWFAVSASFKAAIKDKLQLIMINK